LKLKDELIKNIKDSMPFPQITFDADIDATIKHIFFFSGKIEDKDSDVEMDEDDFINKPKGFMKKNYIYVEDDDSITIKNLGIKKKNISALSKKIFWEHLVPRIKKGQVKFYKTEIDNLMKELLTKDISLTYMRKEVGDLKQYVKSMTGIQAQISKKYGPGIHFLIPNVRNIGVGKGIRYCSVDEFKKYKMTIADIDFTNFWKELNYFVKKQEFCNMFDFE
jgi:DNA polymerase elongation subunit (family B)